MRQQLVEQRYRCVEAGVGEASRYCTHLLDASDNLRFVQDWAGHANIQNTVIYAQLACGSREAKAREAFRKLPRF